MPEILENQDDVCRHVRRLVQDQGWKAEIINVELSHGEVGAGLMTIPDLFRLTDSGAKRRLDPPVLEYHSNVFWGGAFITVFKSGRLNWSSGGIASNAPREWVAAVMATAWRDVQGHYEQRRREALTTQKEDPSA